MATQVTGLPPSNNSAKKGRVLTFGGPVAKVYIGALMIKVK